MEAWQHIEQAMSQLSQALAVRAAASVAEDTAGQAGLTPEQQKLVFAAIKAFEKAMAKKEADSRP